MEIVKTAKDVAQTVLGFVLGVAGCLVHLTLWGIAIILALMLGSCVLRFVFGD